MLFRVSSSLPTLKLRQAGVFRVLKLQKKEKGPLHFSLFTIRYSLFTHSLPAYTKAPAGKIHHLLFAIRYSIIYCSLFTSLSLFTIHSSPHHLLRNNINPHHQHEPAECRLEFSLLMFRDNILPAMMPTMAMRRR